MRGDSFDRAAHLRHEREAWLADDARLVPVWRGKSLVSDERPARPLTPRLADARELVERAAEVAFLGLSGEVPYVMVLLPPKQDPPPIAGGRFADLLRAGIGMADDDFALLAYARSLALFHGQHRFDPATGAPTVAVDGGFARATEGGDKLFPRIDPAVMILVVHEDRCLLARQPRFPPGMYSALAGFVEPGESLEECVMRETLEEVGLAVSNPRYVGSQPWPFPRSLMIGFVADALTTEVKLDEEEIEDARWVRREEALAPRGFFVPPPFSLAHHLIRRWARG